MLKRHNALVMAGLAFAISCGGSSASTAPSESPPKPVAKSDGPSRSQPATPPQQVEATPGASTECPNPSNHCLEPDVVFVATRGYKHGHNFVEPAQPAGNPNNRGESQYKSVRDGKVFTSAYAYRTRPANRMQLGVGKLVVVPFNKAHRIFEGPPSRKDAYGTRWWLSRVVSVADLDKGYATIAGGYRVASTSARLVVNSDDLTAVVSGTGDAHFLTQNHVFVTEGAIPPKGYIYADVAVAVHSPGEPQQGAKQYMLTKDGSIVSAQQVFTTRKAAPSDLKPETVIFMPFQQRGGVFVAPADREQALVTRWWAARVADFDANVVRTHNGYRVSVDAIRVSTTPTP